MILERLQVLWDDVPKRVQSPVQNSLENLQFQTTLHSTARLVRIHLYNKLRSPSQKMVRCNLTSEYSKIGSLGETSGYGVHRAILTRQLPSDSFVIGDRNEMNMHELCVSRSPSNAFALEFVSRRECSSHCTPWILSHANSSLAHLQDPVTLIIEVLPAILDAGHCNSF